MTNYDMVIDAVVNQIYLLYAQTDSWNEELSKQTAHRVLEIVEEYKSKQTSKNKTRKWIIPVEQFAGSDEYFVSFPKDLLKEANLKDGDQIEWIDIGDGSYMLKKVND